MAKKNDNLVAQLLKKVEEKKAQIEKIKNPDYKTNLSFPLSVWGSTNRVNLNVADEETLFSILVYLETMIDKAEASATKHGVVFNNYLYGFTLTEWRNDIVMVLKKKQSLRQVGELREIEKKLNGLLSEEKRTNMELEALSKLLSD